MKLQQIRYLLGVVDNNFNITTAAENLYTSQPGISKQIRLLEDELGVQLFVRRGKRIESLTQAGERAVVHGRRIMQEVENIRNLARELKGESRGSLRLGTTHTQARHVLPPVIQGFRKLHPEVIFDIHQGTSEQIAGMLSSGDVDFVMVTSSRERFPDLVQLPVYQWDRVLLVPRDHPLARYPKAPELEQLARHPLVTYVFSDRPESSLMQAFNAQNLRPNIAFTARDADVIKTYVRMGLGVGVLASMAVEEGSDDDLVALDARHLLPRLTTWVGFRRDSLLRQFQLDFLSRLAPHLTPERVEAAREAENQAEVDALFAEVRIPLHDNPPRPQLAGC
ncbi:LysR substrate-binding domain-containing protein [Gammaproteobacteria bacterium AB-CW1]|uniref:LysR substrate-binding domain-containing protein n=2 Tax=Natronospira TaxID=2024969 RepID=A0AAP6JGJ2_9GAMM|nr:LysR substrate-binding domain-containing protein [Gammaproteobacteria bacterium AB-CW1]